MTATVKMFLGLSVLCLRYTHTHLNKITKRCLTFIDQLPHLGVLSTAFDPAQMPQNAASDLDQHALLTVISMQNTKKQEGHNGPGSLT